MTDAEFLRGFEAATLEAFPHRDHLRVAWLYLQAHPLAEAAARFETSLRRFAAAKGASGKYHATITWAYLVLVQERMHASPGADFDAFLAKNADLLDHARGALAARYDAETLASDLARAVFVLPRPPRAQ